MYLTDVNRLEKTLAKLKFSLKFAQDLHNTPEENQAVQAIAENIGQIEDIIYNLRAAKGSVAGLWKRSLKNACPEEIASAWISANEKGFTITIPLTSLISYAENRNLYEQVTNWAHNLARSCQRFYNHQEVPESEIQILHKLNQIDPKIKMYSVRYTGYLEFNFEASKRLAQSEADREQCTRLIMQEIYLLMRNKKNELGLP
jgi:outer membrane translocation and assembly module TamA